MQKSTNNTEDEDEEFVPGQAPPVVKKGDDEYVVIVSGVKDTGLCGKYWSDIDNLPPRRRSAKLQSPSAASPSLKQTPGKKGSPATPGTVPKETPAKETPKGRGRKSTAMSSDTPKKEVPEEPETSEEESLSKRRSKRKAAPEANETPGKKAKSGEEEQVAVVHSDFEKENQREEAVAAAKVFGQSKSKGGKDAVPASPTKLGHSRSVPCVAGDNNQKEVVVECFAPYDDHR